MDALDNVAAFAERAQDALGFLADYPLVGAEPCGEAKPLKLAGQADQHRPFDIMLLTGVRPKVDEAILRPRFARQRLIERHPAAGVDLPPERLANLLLAGGPNSRVTSRSARMGSPWLI
jgi:hypothetical protein